MNNILKFIKTLSIKLLFVLAFLLLINTIKIESFSLAKCSKNDAKPVILDTSSGRLSGSCEFVNVNDNNPREIKSGNVYSWLGVPYAEPPIGPYRFKSPVEIKRRADLIDATKWPNSCIQSDNYDGVDTHLFSGFSMWGVDQKHSKISEDCLYLNIWLPADAYHRNSSPRPPNSQSDKIPIIVFFHSGTTVSGSSTLDLFNPSTFVTATNTIFITVNFRLGVFGFLYLENEFPGNQALLDQNEALRWIKNNAEKFGGDPNRITISGHGTGATLASLHLFYKDSWEYFRNGILLSGSPLMQSLKPISTNEANKRARELLSNLGCVNETSMDSDIAACAQTASHVRKESINYLKQMTKNNKFAQSYLLSAFIPVLDGHVIAENPLESLKTGNFKKCPIITGFTTDEGSMYIASSGLLGYKHDDIKKQTNLNHTTFSNFIKNYFNYFPEYPKLGNNLLYNSILFEYTKVLNEKNDDDVFSSLLKPNYFQTISKMLGEHMFRCPAYRFADLLAKHNTNVYLYLFAHRLSSTPWPSWYGATHGDDLAFSFAHPISSRQQDSIVGVNPWANPKHRYSNGEKLLTSEIINYWSNFAWYNTPNHKKSNKNWPEYTLITYDNDTGNMTDPNESGRYIIFKTNGTRTNRGYSLDACQFWNSYLPNILKENEKQIENAKSQTPAPMACPYSATRLYAKASQSALIENLQDRNHSFNNNKNNSLKLFSVLVSFVLLLFLNFV